MYAGFEHIRIYPDQFLRDFKDGTKIFGQEIDLAGRDIFRPGQVAKA